MVALLEPFTAAPLPVADHADLPAIKAALASRASELIAELQGQPHAKALSSSRERRWGRNGSFALALQGPNAGAWFDHEADEGGYGLDAIKHLRRCSFAEAVQWAREWLGWAEPSGFAPRSAIVLAPQLRAPSAAQADDVARRVAVALRLWGESAPIAGTLAERYLTDARGIAARLAGWPDCLGFHGASNALILAVTDADGDVRAVQRIYLDAGGAKLTQAAAEARGVPQKRTNGVLDGAAVRLPGDASGPLLIAEGPETGLSAWAATGHETRIMLGSIAKAELSAGRRVVLCRDDDARGSNADRACGKAMAAWRAAGVDVAAATPWPIARADKSDFNDVMRRGGPDAVRARIALALNPPVAAVQRVSVADGRDACRAAVAGFFAAAGAWQHGAENAAPVHGVRIDVGVGKSTYARRGAAAFLAELRGRGDRRAVVIAVPTHRLAVEQAEAFSRLSEVQAAELTVAVWRGREADDPDAPGETMCREPARVRDAIEAGASVQEAACCQPLPGGGRFVCPSLEACAYQRQRARQADIWLVPHDLLFQRKPETIGTIAALVVDEAAWGRGLESSPEHLALDALRQPPAIPGSGLDRQRLQFLRGLALEAMDGAPDGPVSRAAMVAGRLSPENAAEARALELRGLVNTGMRPGMTAAERREAIGRAAGNAMVNRLAQFWRTVESLVSSDGPAASGWAELGVVPTEAGPVRAVALRRRKPIGPGWLVPTLLLDANLSVDLVRHYWPGAVLTADIAVHSPHQHVTQVADKTFSKVHFFPGGAQPHHDRLRELHAVAVRECRRQWHGTVLLVAQKAVEAELPSYGVWPANLRTAHHNAVAGLDQWGKAAALIVVGRTEPRPSAAEALAETLTGAAGHRLPAGTYYAREDAMREMADGSAAAASATRHPDPAAEAIRWQVCEGELVQIIGRARGVNRRAGEPVRVQAMTDVPLPLPVNAVVPYADIAPSLEDMMIAAGGIAYENPTTRPGLARPYGPTARLRRRRLNAKPGRRDRPAARLGTNP